ncbi:MULTISPECIES: DUF2834 domain-containing protein [Pseudoalteromonas]|uniref:DUF2834 domain-containing protein n=1 Tax=Pseudoalteromonas luteoviolacea (strain 2ta16) TaxID=1353533 RepID=V4H4Y2_PSEL2|nr:MULTISPECIES: DUF2834 domain-containing protein [Pseudoalteromonas]ESP92546.1 protein of unknown function (DUF2834) [Pseudoalteromonas luteoviolacea 2ta16]KZN32734.1 hypothetical protein N483_26905 [Pseudoalteromonas luteoviolacea NCIMB 1944]MCG7550560.1 DUF2834 domain-containing protein [Pseudoalteromonas sp. Of7M-16]
MIKYVYGVLCILGIVLPFSMLIPWVSENGLSVVKLYTQISEDQISSFAWLDVLISAFTLIAFILYEGKLLKMTKLWLPVMGTMAVGVSFGLPLFLLMRQCHLERIELAVGHNNRVIN